MSPRPSKLTPETIELLVEGLQKGAFIEETCAYAEISTSTFYAWHNWGKEELEQGGKYTDFVKKMDKAVSHSVVKCLDTIDRVNESDVLNASIKASTWQLSHRHEKRWGDKAVTIRGEGGQTFIVRLNPNCTP